MDYSYLFCSAKLKISSLTAAGFTLTKNKDYFLRKNILDGSFFAELHLDAEKQKLEVHVFDATTNEQYALFDMPTVNGVFVAKLREAVQNIIESIKSKCFETKNLRDKYVSYLQSHFSANPDFPWESTPDACVFRCSNNKWFALIMKIKYRQLGLKSEEEVFVVNLKADENTIPTLIDNKSIFKAYHMNKKHWITILLTAVTDFDTLCELTQNSYELVSS